jgi:hypothetical protein
MYEFVFVVVTFGSHELTKLASADLIVVLFLILVLASLFPIF